MAFHDQPFHKRLQTLGDPSEAAFAEALPLGPADRFGWRRPDISMVNMEDFIRYKPDFFTQSGWLVEVLGCGNDRIAKLKETKAEALHEWSKKQRLALFVWNSTSKEWVLTPWPQVRRYVLKIRRQGPLPFFPSDRRPYFPLDFDYLLGLPESGTGRTQ